MVTTTRRDETRRLARSLRACSISLRCFRYNKGLGFTEGERDRLYLRGLLPPAVLSQDVQAERVLTNLNNMISCVACCVLRATYYLLRATCYLLLATCYVLRATCCLVSLRAGE